MQLARARMTLPSTPPAAPATGTRLPRVAAMAAFALAMLLLAAPALWNGYPLLQYDTGGYLARWHEGTLVLARSTVYALLLYVGEAWHFWPVVAIQAAATAWVVGLVLRCLGLARGPAPVLAVLAILCVATALPWLASVLITDIFAGLGVLAFYLVLFRWDALGRHERIGLTLVLAFAVASHSATLAMLLALVAAAAFVTICIRPIVPAGRLVHAAAAILLGVVLVLAANFALVGRLVWTPGGFELAFGRMLQDGIVARYLDDHCVPQRPEAGTLKLCPYRRELPPTADEFLWDSEIFDKLGRFDGLRDEMRAIVLGSLAEYPLLQLKAALAATARQLALVETGWGMHDILPHSQGIIEQFVPGDVAAMRAARQQRGEVYYDTINRLHVPVAYTASLLMLGLLWRLRRAPPPEPPDALALLAATVTLATLANAGILGILSGPHDRYGARIAWLAVLVVLLWGLQALRRRGERRRFRVKPTS